MKTKTIAVITILFLAILILCLGCISATGAKEPSERFKGYNKERDKWTVGNLGKAYVEGDFVSYQLRIDKASKVWKATEFSISFNFHQPSSGAIYVDGFDTSDDTGFQWSTQDFLPDGTETPPSSWGTPIPTPDATGVTPGPGEAHIGDYMDAWPPETVDDGGSVPAEFRYFTVYNLPWTGDHIILFFRAHLALDIVWSAGLEAALPTVLDGDEFETWTAMWHGASFATGSSRHFFLEYEGIGGKTIPIPIAMYPSTVINGHKYVNEELFNGWMITLTGNLSLDAMPPIPYNPPPVETGMGDWETGYFEFTGLIEGSYKVQEEDRYRYVHVDIDTYGDGNVTGMNIAEGWISFDLPHGGTRTVDFYNLEYIDLEVFKTATPSWEQALNWTIVKTATPELSEIFVGDMTDVKYTITVTAYVDYNVYNVSGIITIDNPNPAVVEVYATILDEVWYGIVLKGSQDLTPGGLILIPEGVSTYPYSITLSPPVEPGETYINKVTVEVTAPVNETYSAEEPFSFTTPTDYVDDYVNVEDSYYGFLGTVYHEDSPTTFEPPIRTFGPYSATGSDIIVNTATATGDDTGTVWTANATVEIVVYDITVTKTVIKYWERVFEWSVEKSVEVAQLKPFINDQIEVRYTVDVVKTVGTDTFSVSGTITIVNNNPDKYAEVYVIDKIWYGMTVVASQDLGTHTIAPGATLELDYNITFAAKPGKEYTNKAHVYLNNYHWDYTGVAIGGFIDTTEFIGIENFTYYAPDLNIHDWVTVTDVQSDFPDGLEFVWSDYTGGWTTNDNATFYVNKVVKAVEVGTWDLEDEAFAQGDKGVTWSSGVKTLTFNVHNIVVSKTAEPWWKREFNWTIDKSVEPTELILYKGETGTVTYTVTITKFVAADIYKVNGTITIVNNNPEKSAVVHVTDKIYHPNGSVVASQYLGTYTIANGTTLELNYTIFFTPEIGIDYTNVAQVDLENYLWKLDATEEYLYNTEFTGDANFTFTEPTTLLDNSATVEEDETVPPEFSVDVDYGPHGMPPWTVTDSITIVFTKNITEVSAMGCNWYDLPNTVTLTESDTLTVRWDSALIQIHVVMPYTGTVGYWKNHPEEWVDILPNATFPGTGYTYMQILWMSNEGGDASIKLAQQYIAALLNKNAFGVPTSIEDAINEAETFLTSYPPGSDPPDPPRGDMIDLADFLEDYNSGGISPP